MPVALRYGLPLAAFVIATAIAELAGAPNLGTAMTFGQLLFAVVLVTTMARR